MSNIDLHKRASMYATKITKRDSSANTVGEAREEFKQLIKDKPHQFSLKDKVTTLEQANQRANYFSEVDGHYPTGMSVCYTVGISGDCGFSCPDFQSGICEHGESMLEKIEEVQDFEDFSKEEIFELMDLYGIEGIIEKKMIKDYEKN